VLTSKSWLAAGTYKPTYYPTKFIVARIKESKDKSKNPKLIIVAELDDGRDARLLGARIRLKTGLWPVILRKLTLPRHLTIVYRSDKVKI
jgi:hypothetical protein